MGLRKRMNNFFKKKEKGNDAEFQHRAGQFVEEYKMIRSRYQCDFLAKLNVLPNGAGMVPTIEVIDITEDLKKAEDLAEKKAEADADADAKDDAETEKDIDEMGKEVDEEMEAEQEGKKIEQR